MDAESSNIQLLNSDGKVVVRSLEVARSLQSRIRGLLGRDRLPCGEALLIERCRSIHMFGMRFAIDAVFLDREMRILRIVSELRPWQLACGPRQSLAVLELAAGEAARLGLAPGNKLALKRPALLSGQHSPDTP